MRANPPNYDKAIKFLAKSLQLYPLPGVEALKARAEAEMQRSRSTSSATNNASSSSSSNSSAPAGEGARRRTPSSAAAQGGGGGGGGGGGQNGRPYTEEQVVACRAVIQSKKKGHYEVLRVTRTATDDEIKRSYRKLALRFHPDKNAAPEADEAFKAIGTAFAVLSDGDKRRTYDQFGDEEGPGAAAAHGHPFRHADVSPEEIFNMFFGMNGGGMGGMGGGRPGNFRVYRSHQDPRNPFFRYQQQQQQQQQQQRGQQQAQHPLGAMSQFIQMLPVLLLLFLSLFSIPQETERPFSLHRTDRYPLQRSTAVEHVLPNIPYFVSNTFGRDYARDWRRLRAVEREVQNVYVGELARTCDVQKGEKARLIQSALRVKDPEEREQRMAEAEARPLESCRLLQEARRLL